MNSGTESLPRCVLEEIALEGLDGITIEGLWKRIGVRMKYSLPLSDKLTDAIWNYMKSVKCFSYYLLSEPREPLKIYDRADCIDPKTGAPTEPDDCPYNVYKYNPITNDTVRGSCEHFATRKEFDANAVQSMSHRTVEEEYGLRFVIVASQSLRNSMLIPASLPSNIDLTISNYCILERLGRARHNGELANGTYSLSNIVGDPVHFHSIKKKLLRNKLIETQPIYHVVNGQNFGSQLLHLPQFYAMFKPRHMMMTEKIIELLKEEPNYMATLHDIRSHFDEPLRYYFKRLVKHTFFQKFITLSYRIPYRIVYPKASEREWRLKNKEERTVTALQLSNPDMEMSEIWPHTDTDGNEENKGFLSESNEVFEVPLLVQVYDFIRSSKENGVSEPDIGRHFGQSRLVRRSVVKEIKRCAKIDRFVTNEGRQKTGRYLLPEYNKMRLEKLYRSDPLAETGNVERIDVSAMIKLETAQSGELDSSTLDIVSEPANLSEKFFDLKPIVDAVEDDRVGDGTTNDLSKSKECLIVESDIDTQIIEIFKTKSCLRARYKTALNEKSLTEKMLRRYQFMNAAIQANEFIDNPTRLYMLVVDDEKMRGLQDCMCRKTFNRLLTCLCVSKRIRLWRITFKYKTKLRALTYISTNHIDTDYAMMQSCIKQARNRFILSVYDDDVQRANAHRRNQKPSTLIAPSNETPSAIVSGSRLTIASKHISNYGNTPKFVRLRTLHEFLFYLVHESSTTETDEVISRADAIEHWRRNETFVIDYDDLDDMPPIYSKIINWKMFVPPMELHKDLGIGWCLTSDCLFRMPLSVFVRVVNMAYEIRGLDEMLSHPIKKHYLLNRLPVELQQALFHRRKYLFSIDDLLKRLCCMGLAQAGPQRLQSKDKRFYYFNRKATLLNTVTSRPGYLQTSVQDYPERLFQFSTSVDLQMYWDDMYKICMATKLNRKSADDGSLPHYAILTDQVIKMSCQPVDPAEAIQRDIGLLPGDRRGAAGLDTSFFAHIERNWSFNSNIFKNRPTLKALATASSTSSSLGAPIRYNKLVRITRDSNTQKREIRIQPVPLHKLTTSTIRRRQPVSTRKRAQRTSDTPRKKATKNIIDDVDRAALKLMSSTRVEWSTPEDNFLLLCRLAQMYLTTTANRTVPSTVIRDLLHWHCKSLNKTSRACARRIVYIMKQLTNSCQINHSVLSCLGEIKENKAIKRRFGNLASKLRILYPTDVELAEAFKIHFIDLVHTLSRQYYNLRDCHELNMLALPPTIAEFNSKFIVKSELYNQNTLRFDPPENKDDIEVITLISLIHSTMCCNHDKTSFSIQLYEVYKDFPERQLSAAMQKVRTEQLISVNKLSKRHVQSSPNRCLPLSASSYHLSITYQQQMYTKISYELFEGAFPCLREIVECTTDNEHPEPFAFNVWNSMMCFFLSELVQKSKYEISIEVPKRILILDPTKNVHNETFERMYARLNEFDTIDPDDPLGEESVSLKKLPAQELMGLSDELGKSEIDELALILAPKLNDLPNESFHFVCIANCHGQTFSLRGISLSNANGKCTLNCLKRGEAPIDEAIKSIIAQREIWGRLMVDYQVKPTQLSDEVEVNDFNVLAIYNHLLRRKIGIREERNIEIFQQLLDIVDEIVTNHEKRNCISSLLGHDLDFDEYYDAETNAKKKPDVEITDKQHKFHDFLYVKTCKLSLQQSDPAGDGVDIKKMVAKREKILDAIVQNAHWTSKITINADFVEAMTELEFSVVEVQLGVDVYGFIESRKELGATTSMLKARYEDHEFLEKVLNIMVQMKMIMKTGVCQLTYVHRSFVKPWIVNTYHLKRLNREATHPTSMKLMQIADSVHKPSELKRRPPADESSSNPPRRKSARVENEAGTSAALNATPEIVVPTASTSADIDSRGKTKMSKRFENVTIPRGSRPDNKTMPQQIATFALKLAPWMRINGSLNRRVLDKYMGTILLYCIENFGLTLFHLCTRFHYLPPVHIKELIQYLEDFGCVTTTTFPKPTASLFSTYESSAIRPATDLDEFDDIIVEPTADAVTRMSVFIGDKKYKEDFI